MNQIRQIEVAGDANSPYTPTYDANGNMTSDGTNVYTWDRANRLISMGGHSYQYDGLSNRIQQSVGATVTDYLLDLQAGLPVVLAATTGTNTDRFIHSVRGIHAMENNAGAWRYLLPDSLNSVRSEVDANVAVIANQNYAPYGTPFDTSGSFGTPFGFTGESRDENELIHLRARYLNPGLGVFASLDPDEGTFNRTMSLNGYSWVEGNTPNAVDPSGMSRLLASILSSGGCQQPSMPVYDLEATCINRCRDDFNPAICVIQCQDEMISNFRSDVIDATVVIGTAGDSSPDNSCNIPAFGQASRAAQIGLGTFTNDGLWTHDHFTPADPEKYLRGDKAANPAQAKEYLKSWPCIIFTGAHRSIVVHGRDLNVDDNVDNVKVGTLKIMDSQRDSDGFPQQLSTLGRPVSTFSGWRPDQQPFIMVAHIRGDNFMVSGVDHSIVDVFEFEVDVDAGQFPSEGRQVYKVKQVSSSNPDIIMDGDSGGGIFSNNVLVGILFRQDVESGGRDIFFRSRFVNGLEFVTLG